MNLRSNFSWARYCQWLDAYLDDRRGAVNWQSAQRLHGLVTASIFALLISLQLYLAAGYHAGFRELHELNAYLPAAVLANVTFLGDTIFALCVLAVLAWRFPSAVWVGLLAAIVAGLINTTMKKYFGTLRPPGALPADELTIIGIAAKKTAFPSGHTASAFAVASVMLMLSRSYFLNLVLVLVAISAALSRVLVGVHWPVDLGVGAAVGMLCVWWSCRWNARTTLRVGPKVHLLLLSLLLSACIIALGHTGGYPQAQALSIIAGLSGLAALFWGYLIKPYRELSA